MERHPQYLDRIDRLKEKVFETYPEIDLEDAKLLTQSFLETQGEALVTRKAKAFLKQCREKSVKIWDDELIVGNAGSKIRGGILSADVCWSVLDRELETINTRKYDKFRLPPEDKKDIEDVFKLLDWDKNVDPHYRKHYFRRPIVETETEQYVQKWITYANPYIAAKELTVYPGQTVTIKDGAAYGCIFVQGHGKFGVYDAEAPTLLHFGQQSSDEFFVSEQASVKGITITNTSKVEPLVVLKHFGPNCPGVPQEVPEN